MKKKIISISLLTILIATLSLTMTSCFEHHLRPSGVYSTYEYKDEAKGKTYRVLVNFIQENLDDKKGVSGHVQYAKQEKKEDGTWKTIEIKKGGSLTYQTINPMTQTKSVVTSERLQIVAPTGVLFSVSFKSNLFKVETTTTTNILGIPREEIKDSEFADGKYQGFVFHKVDDKFPSSIDD